MVSSEGRRDRGPMLVRAILLGVTIGGVLTAIGLCGFGVASKYGDAWNYLAAGERLNAGHPLYALAATDRPVQIIPPYWSVPLLSPPPIAVLWRPLALLGESGLTVWGVLTIAGAASAAILLLRRSLTRGLAVVAPLAAPLSITALSGNVNVLLVPALLCVWWWRSRPWLSGSFLAVAIATKVTPGYFLLWLVFARRWRVLGATITVSLGVVGASALGAGVDAWFDWLRAAPTAMPSPLALATALGTSTTVVYLLGAAAVIGVAVVGRDEGAVFAACAAAAALTTPALYHQALALLVVCGAPLVARSSLAPSTPRAGCRISGARQAMAETTS